MTYAYLFEAKSIQQYLFSSGKLKDVISASERLDRLIDNDHTSVLSHVLKQANLTSDLLESTDEKDAIHFLRCKGGAFYATCSEELPLKALRSLWTLTVTQLFPSMVFTDALTQGDSLQQAIDSGHKSLAADRNAPKLSLPYAPSIAARYPRTGKAAVPLSKLAIAATGSFDDKEINSVDIDTERHRQAYQSFNLREDAALQDRFTPMHLQGQIKYPIDFEKEFKFEGSAKAKQSLSKQQSEAIKDMALIHVDGNGLGILLMKLKTALQDHDEQSYRQAFRRFSDALNKATVTAAREATLWLYEHVLSEESSELNSKDKFTLPMRPIVLGGDDITLFCRADLAMQYARTFCIAFKKSSADELKNLNVDLGGIDHLTASGGVLFHKASHPFIQSHDLVEKLCSKAKVLTKSLFGLNNTDKVGPAALAFYRVSNATKQDLNVLLEQGETVSLDDQQKLHLGQGAYFVENDSNINGKGLSHQVLANLDNLMDASSKPQMSRFRQMATELSEGNLVEANRIFHRGLSLAEREAHVLNEALSTLNPTQQIDWYWKNPSQENSDGHLTTMLKDLLILDHYKPLVISQQPAAKEAAL
ncbi:Cas10/Cmr2 second palm domain-containing protein [Vibrio breoganii]|uniref:Cas10/Cmr2 second palm domain-containing protein n=1 Tax=Vibrio breoganii TaxID=553239 RepID=UPI0010BD72FE|nr:hypothetical protein [Vibrio breoganii]TKG19928.1 hypothetical protein FCV81_11350 [Vibrio breoganii]